MSVIRIKRRTSGAPGAPASLQNAELAFNEVDGVLYYGKGTGGAGGSATTIEAIGGKAMVSLAGADTISGDKTFTGKVSVPDGTLAGHAINKGQLDAALLTGGAVTSVAGRAGAVVLTVADVTNAASTSYVDTKVAALVNGAPGTLDTLKELSDALGADANFAVTVTNQIALKAAIADLKTVAFTGAYADLTGKPTFDGTYGSLTGRPTLATVATSGSYVDLTNKPTMFSGAYVDLTGKPALTTVATSGSYVDLINKPTFATVATTGSYNDLLDKPAGGSGYTDASARAALSATGSLSYNSTTGVMSYTAPTVVSAFTNDAGYLTAADLDGGSF